MKQYGLAVMFGAMLLVGCATTRQGNDSATSETQNAVPAQPVAVPVAAAKKVVLSMTGPATVTQSSSWASFKEEWQATFADHAKEAGIVFSMQDGDAKPDNGAGTLLSVYVNDFRQVGIGSRIFFGVMTGNAFIDAKVDFKDLQTGKLFGSQTYNTTSSAWQGVFGSMTPQQVDNIASGIFQEFKVAH